MSGYIEDDLRFYDRHSPPPPSVSVSNHFSRETGVLDANGNMIYRKHPPIGFGRDDEWYAPVTYE